MAGGTTSGKIYAAIGGSIDTTPADIIRRMLWATPNVIGSFLLGSLAYRYRSSFDRVVPEHAEKYWFYVYPLVVGFAVVRVRLPLATLAYPMALACALPFVFKVTSRYRVDRVIGELSYPFYIFHWLSLALVAFAVRHWWHGPVGSTAWMGLGLTLLLSAIGLVLEFRFIEPWRVRLAERRPLRGGQLDSGTSPLKT